MWVARQDDGAFAAVQPALWVLRRAACGDLVGRVAVGVLDRDVAVRVPVGATAPQPVNEGGGEDRRTLAVLVGVLAGPGSRQHRPAAPGADEPTLQFEIVAAL